MSVPQSRFNAALLDPVHPVPEGLSDAEHRPAGRRFNVYRNNVAVSLTEALCIGFPVITKLLGRENMNGLTGIFLRAHPPMSPLMMHYGSDFPDFLANTGQLAHLGYLADVARLELAIRESYHAADAAPIAQEDLAALAPSDLFATTVTLAPAIRLIRSDWPIFDIWRFNTADDAPKPRHVRQDVVITRPEFDPEPHLLCAGAADWITGLSNGQSIGAAHDAALRTAPDFDLAASLAVLLQGGALITLNQKG